jgi:bla regulator protein blaR1
MLSRRLESWFRFIKKSISAVGITALAALPMSGLMNSSPAQAQSSAADWEKAAGGKMSFDVASIKQNKSGPPPSGDRVGTNIALDSGDDYTPTGGLLRATNFLLSAYIEFAYKLTPTQHLSLESELPKWATANRFNIEARAAGNPTKDQMRLMMQSLLVDRFKLAIHFETRQLPVFAMLLVKPGKPGPKLQPYADGVPCDFVTPPVSRGSAPTPPPSDDGWMMPCGNLGARFVSGRVRVGSRNVSIEQIAGDLVAASLGTLDRPVLDKTGLTGNFNFGIEFTPEEPPTRNFQPDSSGPSFLEALKEQLGLKLEAQTGPVDVLVIDHIEEPSEN